MAALSMQISCVLLLVIFIQTVSLYRLYSIQESKSLDEELPEMNLNSFYNKRGDENSIPWQGRPKRTLVKIGLDSVQHRRNNRAHWNPLVAAYKRCGDLLARDEREACFKDAVQMLFVHKL